MVRNKEQSSSMIYLTRINSDQNMQRFYSLDIQPNLFGEWCLIRKWGRIRSNGRRMETSFSTLADAEKLQMKLAKAKRSKGYNG